MKIVEQKRDFIDMDNLIEEKVNKIVESEVRKAISEKVRSIISKLVLTEV
jgi:hypothetical protein